MYTSVQSFLPLSCVRICMASYTVSGSLKIRVVVGCKFLGLEGGMRILWDFVQVC